MSNQALSEEMRGKKLKNICKMYILGEKYFLY